jgi:HK97 family phage portal protein
MGLVAWTKSLFRRENKFDPAYSVAMQFFSPGQPVWSEKNYSAFTREGYRRNGTVYTCINKISGVASGIKWKLYTDETKSREIEKHPLLDLWKKPNPKMGTGAFVEQIFGFWHMSGNSYVYANCIADNEPPLELWPLRPDRVKIVLGDNDIQGYVYGYGSPKAQDFDVTKVMHLKFPAYDDDFYGLSPIEVASNLIDQQNEGNSWNTALMQNAGKPASVFTSKQYLTTEQRQQVRDELRRRYSGKRNAGMPLILEADMTWQQMSMSPYELDWLQSRELNTRDIASIFDIAPELVGDSAGKTFANQKEAKQSLYTENVLPKMDRCRDHLNMWLVPMYKDLKSMGAYFTYDTADIEVLQEIYQAQRKAKIDQINELWMNGLMMQCDAQEELDLPVNPKGKIYRFGAIFVREEDTETYAEQSLVMPAAPPAPIAEPLALPPGQIVDASPSKQPAKPQQGNATPSNNQQNNANQQNTTNEDDGKRRWKRIHRANDYKSVVRLPYADEDPNYKIWQCAASACDFCLENDGVMVDIDASFPNGCDTPDDCHRFCKCQAYEVHIPDDTDADSLSAWGIAAIAGTYGVRLLAARHERDMAAQRAKEQHASNASSSDDTDDDADNDDNSKFHHGMHQRSIKANDDTEHKGIMIAFFIDPKSAKKLVIKDGEDPQDLHITLAYIKNDDNKDLDINALKTVVKTFASYASPLQGSTSGVGRFNPSSFSDGLSPVYASVNIEGLQKWRMNLVDALNDNDVTVASNFDYTPHITLSYIDANTDTPINSVPALDLSFDTVWLCVDDDRYAFTIGDKVDDEKSTINAILTDIQEYLSNMGDSEIEALYETSSSKTAKELYQNIRANSAKTRLSQRSEGDIVQQQESDGRNIEPAKERQTSLSPRTEYRKFMEAMTK